MITLIAESKTMRDGGVPVAPEIYAGHKPVGEIVADEIMHRLALMSVQEIAAAIKISPVMASKVAKMAYEFPNKQIGLRAMEAFTGVVFKAFDYESLSTEDKVLADDNVRIISSLYGWLVPSDIVKTYRTDFTTRIAPFDGPCANPSTLSLTTGTKTLAEYWRKDVTIQLVRELQRTGETDILDLMPGDAAKCIDWKFVKRFAKVWKVDFKELKDGCDLPFSDSEEDSKIVYDPKSYRTPHAGKLKTLRGELLREIVTRRLSSPAALLRLETDSLLPLRTPDYPDHIAFCV
ncbi:MAG: YaaA family protein [Muribaculaceae bacterium]|nr:YaaA family protein [Muribaculaceae bacterium]